MLLPLAMLAGAVFLRSQLAPASAKATTKGKKAKGGNVDAQGMQWLRKVYDETHAIIDTSGMPVAVAYGQLALETGYGKAGRGAPWGVKGKGDAGSSTATTHENIDHAKVVIRDDFAKYTSLQAAARGYCDFLSGKRYREGWDLRDRPERWALWVWGIGYASADYYIRPLRDCSRHMAELVGRDSLRLNFTAEELAIADKLSKQPAGPKRWALCRKLLHPGLV